MNTRGSGAWAADAGGVLVCAVVLTAVMTMAAGSVLYSAMSYRRTAEATHFRDRAFYLAEAGLNSALVKLNAHDDANIAYAESRRYFSDTSVFDAPDWGFQTVLSVRTNGQQVVTSTGRFRGNRSSISAVIALSGGQRSIHALYAHALYAGNFSGDSNYVMRIGGSGSGADFVVGDVYSGGALERTGDAYLRNPELLHDTDGDGVCAPDETWEEALVTSTFDGPLTSAAFAAYSNSVAGMMSRFYGNGRYDVGEAFLDTIGNGIYEEGEPFTDLDGNGVRTPGDEFTDLNGNGIYDPGEPFVDQGNGVYDDGEEWIEDSEHTDNKGKTVRLNGRRDEAGGYWKYNTKKGTWQWKTAWYTLLWPAEAFEDGPDGVYEDGEPFVDGNGVYDEGESFVDDRNGIYDYGTQARGSANGMPSPLAGQSPANGHNASIDSPDLVHMYYELPKNSTPPLDALVRWGHDVAVTASDYGSDKAINNPSNPRHIFVRNPPTSGSTVSDGARIYGRSYDKTRDNSGNTRDDYFLEDPTDPTFNSYVNGDSIDGTVYTAPMYIDVRPEHNVKVYYIDGNLYIHNPRVYSMRFRRPGTRVTFVVRGNITISDEFYYNAIYPAGLRREDLNSTIVHGAQDALCLIALTDSNVSDSGNIYLGDAQFGTGGGVHAMLYAENNFVDNNLNTTDQEFLSVFGNMTAGNHVLIKRTGYHRTRLDITLDGRIRDGLIVAPGLPHPVGVQRSIQLDTAWGMVPGSWASFSRL